MGANPGPLLNDNLQHLTGDAGYRDWVRSLSDDERAYFERQLDAIPKKNVSTRGLLSN